MYTDEIFCLFYAYTKVLKRNRRKYMSKKFLSMISTDPDC